MWTLRCDRDECLGNAEQVAFAVISAQGGIHFAFENVPWRSADPGFRQEDNLISDVLVEYRWCWLLPASRLVPVVPGCFPPVADNSNRIAPAQVEAPPTPTVTGLDQEKALRDSMAVVGQRPVDHTLFDQDGQAVSLSDFRGKPLLVNFVYTACFRICPNSTRALRKAVDAMRGRFGTDQFNVISIGFDQPTDSPTAMREYAARQSIRDANWRFLSPDKDDVAEIARNFGFSFMATPMGFDHTLQVSVLDADGIIRQQVLGDTFSPDSLGEPLKRLLGGSLIRRRARGATCSTRCASFVRCMTRKPAAIAPIIRCTSNWPVARRSSC